MFLNIISLILTVVTVVLIGVILKLPDLITNTWLEKTKNKNAHDIQIESYFKQLGGKEQQKVLDIWTDFLVDMDKTTKKYNIKAEGAVDNYHKLMHDTVVYGSDRTVNLLSLYNHYTFVAENSTEKSFKMMVYVAFLISSLKEDFSGYYISPLTLLKITIKDFDTYKTVYSEYAKEIEDGLNKR